ncbi:hypothetical protein NBRC116494_24530 [Aurantivibrio plasticivorans]
MFSASEYFIGWLFYIAASIGLLIVWWRITALIIFTIPRDVLRLLAAALLLIPFPVSDATGMLAPAFIMSLLEAMFVREAGFTRAGVPVILFSLLTLIVYAGLNFGLKRVLQKRQAKKAQNEKELSAHEELLEEHDKASQADGPTHQQGDGFAKG